MLPEIIALAALSAATATDLKTREVSDKVSYGLMAFAGAWQIFLSLTTKSFAPILDGAAGFIAFFGIGYALYKFNQWGGGDTKILGALGALFGIKSMFMARFFINLLLFGALYGIIYAVYTAIKNKGKIKYKKTEYARTATAICLLLLFFGAVYFKETALKILFSAVVLLSYTLFFLLNFMEAVQKQAFQRYVTPMKLTEGDWIGEDIELEGKIICRKKDNGLTPEQLKELQTLYRKGKIKQVLLKEGIPFLPSFLMAFIATWAGVNMANALFIILR
jgi:Flp pilus assembly protein protease CpaA